MILRTPPAPRRSNPSPEGQSPDAQETAPASGETTPSEVANLQALIEANACPAPEPGHYWALLDEREPNGLVVLRRASGHPLIFMSRRSFDRFRKLTPMRDPT